MIKQLGRVGYDGCSPNFLALPACLIGSQLRPCLAGPTHVRGGSQMPSGLGLPKQAFRITLRPPHCEFKANLGFFDNVDFFF